MTFLFYIILLHSYFKGILSFLNQEEIKISLDLIRELEIRQTVLVGNGRKENLISHMKEFSSANIPITHLKYYPLPIFIDNATNVYFRTVLIFNEKNLVALEKLSKIFQKADQTYKLGYFVWLVFLQNWTENLQINKLNFPYDCQFIVVQSENETTYKFSEIYKIKNESFSLDFGTWHRDSGLKVPAIGFYRRRSNFQETEIRVVSYVGKNSFFNSPFSARTMQILDGFFYTMNLTFRRHNEIILDDAINEVVYAGDISTYQLSDDLYTSYLDTVGPISRTTMNWYINYPRARLRSDYYLQPFDIPLWCILLIVIVIGTGLIIITQNWIKYKKRSLTDNLFLGLESFCNQCGNDNIETTSLRMICICLRLIAIISAFLYGAIITSFFTVEKFQPPFTNVEGFLANGEYQLIFLDKVTAEEFMEKYQKHRIILKTLVKVIEPDQLEKYICLEKYAVTFPYSVLEYLNLPCKMYKVPHYIDSWLLGIYLKKYSPFTKIFNKNFIRFYEIGFQTRYDKKMTDISSLKKEEEDSLLAIEIEHMAQVLSILVAGILLGMTIIVIEIINKRLKKTKKGKRSLQ